MANTWLRLYHDMPNDPKWRTIARVSKQPISIVLGVYVHLLTIASGAPERGTLDSFNTEDLATALDVDSAAVDAVLGAMQGRVLDGQRLSGWEKRQANREDSSTERVKRFRERNETHVTHGNAVKHNVTADKSRGEEIRTEGTKKKQKTSRSEVASDPRHVVFRNEIERYATQKSVLFVWDQTEASQLALLLKAAPMLDLAGFQKCLLNRARSPGTPHGDRPRVWLPHILKYQEAPLNEFGKTGGSNGTFKGKSGHSVDAAKAAIEEVENHHASGAAWDSETGEAGQRGLPSFCG